MSEAPRNTVPVPSSPLIPPRLARPLWTGSLEVLLCYFSAAVFLSFFRRSSCCSTSL